MGRMSYRRLKNELGWSTTGPFKCVEQEETPKRGPAVVERCPVVPKIRTIQSTTSSGTRNVNTNEDGTVNFDGDKEKGAGAACGACELITITSHHTTRTNGHEPEMTRSRTDHQGYWMIVEQPDIHSYYRLFGWHGLVFMRHTVFEIDRILPSMHHDPI